MRSTRLVYVRFCIEVWELNEQALDLGAVAGTEDNADPIYAAVFCLKLSLSGENFVSSCDIITDFALSAWFLSINWSGHPVFSNVFHLQKYKCVLQCVRDRT